MGEHDSDQNTGENNELKLAISSVQKTLEDRGRKFWTVYDARRVVGSRCWQDHGLFGGDLQDRLENLKCYR